MSKREQVRIGRDSGRVKVFVRIRPLNKEENKNKIKNILKVSEEKGQISVLSDSSKQPDKVYHFDHVFSSTKTNQQVCDKLSQPIVDSALNGFNGTLMAYGQTGTGKTHTLMAPDGIAQNIIHKVFDQIHGDGSHYYKVSAAYLQIYQEKIHDLLNFNNKVELNIREKPKSGIFVENLTEYVIRSGSEALSLLVFGKKRLVFAETKMNRTSSRSHSVFQLTIEKTPRREKHTSEGNESKKLRTPMHTKKAESVVQMIELEDDLIVKGKIHLCDLAGSERIKKTHAFGERLCEAQHINSSLLELGNVIQALADEKSTHIPFRNSILTRLLQESLGGNCKTSLIVCIAPGLKDLSETKSTLNFGLRAMKIENIAYVNVEIDYKRLSESLLKRLEEQECELHRLRQEQSQIEQCTEKIVLEKRLEEICSQSELIIKSLKSTHDIEIKDLNMKIRELTEGMKLKDEQIEKILYENNILKDERATEAKIAKLLLVNEIASLEILSATEFERIHSCKAQYNRNHHQDIVEAMLEHCQMMLEGAQFFLRESNQISPKAIDPRESKISQIQCRNSGNVWKDMNTTLIKSKKILDTQLKKIFQKEYHTQDLDTPKDSVLWDLCKLFVDKGFLASHLALENYELRQENKLLMEKKNRLHNVRKEEETSKDVAGKLQGTLEDSIDVDKTLSGFEFTLSKIEKILSDETNLERNEPTVDKKEISSARNQLELSERAMGRNLRNTESIRKGNSNEVQWTRKATDEGNIDDTRLSKGSSMKEKEHLIKSITKKQEENLAQFLASEENLIEVKYEKSSMKMSSKFFVGPMKNEEVLPRGSVVNELEPSKDEEDLTSAILSEAKELSHALDQYLNIHEVIKEVKTEIEKQKLNRQKEDKAECKKSIKEIRKIASKNKRTFISRLRTQGCWITNPICEPKKLCEIPYATTVVPFEYFSMLPLPCLYSGMPPCCWKGGLIETRNGGAHCYGEYNPDYPVLPKCVPVFCKLSRDGVEKEKQENYCNELGIDTRLTLYKANGKNPLNGLCNGYEKDCYRSRHQTIKGDLNYVKTGELKSRTESEESCKCSVLSNVCTDSEQLKNANDEEKKQCDDFDLVMKCSAKSCNSFTGEPNLEDNFEVNTNSDISNIHEIQTLYENTEHSQSPFARITKENACTSYDEELNLRFATFNDEIDNDYEINDKHQYKYEKRKEKNEKLSIAHCSMLEVQIVSGSEGYYCYGDSFVSPLSKSKFSYETVSKEDSLGLCPDDITTASIDDGKITKSDNVIVKTPWSLSNWLWGKRTKAKGDEESATVCQ